MEKKRFILFVLGILSIVMVTVSVVIWAKVREEKKCVQLETTMIQTEDTGESETEPTEMVHHIITLPEDKDRETERKKEPAVIFYLDSLFSFLSKEQVEEIKDRILVLMPLDAKKDSLSEVSCLTYQKVSVEEMTVDFYLCDNHDNVYEGNYNFKTAELAVEKSGKTKEKLERLAKKEQERIAASEKEEQERITKQLESERAAESERIAESVRAEQEKREKKKKKQKRQSETATVTEQEPIRQQ